MINGHGDDLYLYEQKITANFSSNAFYGADLHGLKQHLSEHMEVITSYPEPEPYTLEALMAQKYGLQKEEVCVTNGATEAIYLVAQAFAGCRSGIVMPTFSEYADACCMHQHRVTSLYSLQMLPNNLEMLWLCNPNNPTGKVFDKAELTALISKHSDICFVIDQSYEDFTLKPLLSASEAAEFPNVILLHSLTKRFSIPGLRLGYVTASSALLQRIRMKRMPWSVNALAIEAGKYLLNKTDNVLNIEEYLLETDRLASLLQKTGCFDVWPTDTHYLLAKLRIGKASALKDYLAKEHGMLIRNASNFEGLDDSFIRIAAQTPEQNNALVSAIDCYLTKN